MSHEPSLEWLIEPVSKELFFNDYWEKRPLVVRREQPNYFASLLSLDEVDRVIATRYADITLKNARHPIADDYTVGGALDVAKVHQLFAEGSTITLAYLDTAIPALTLFCRCLEKEFSCPLQTNAYLTPASAQGAKPHYDTHDVFVLQVAGSKRWTIYGTPAELPLPGQDFDASLHPLGEPTLEFELQAGDVAYIPRGVAHDAHSTDVVSLHITTGVLRYTWADLLLEFVAGASLQNPAFRKALPPGFAAPGFDRAQARETMQSLLRQAWTPANFETAMDHFVDEFIAACPPLLEGQMSQIAALDRLTAASIVGARPGVNYRLRTNGASESIECYGRSITFPQHAGTAVRFALTHARFVVSDLAGNLDDMGKLTLVRRLIREGLVCAFPLY